jgi:hypothetical protein
MTSSGSLELPKLPVEPLETSLPSLPREPDFQDRQRLNRSARPSSQQVVRWPIVLGSWVLAFAPCARADDGLRCGEWLVSVGATQTEALKKCGPPSQARRRVERYRTRYGTRQALIEEWTYDRGPGEFIRTLTFEDQILKRVDTGEYGRSIQGQPSAT